MTDAVVFDPFRPAGLPHPSPEAVAHGRRTAHHIRGRIEAQGPIPFSDYMELCLNAPGLGYYTAGSAKFGPEGDFVTAPEISPLFGRSVARQVESVLELLGGGEILELGGGTGAFAESCLTELSRRGANPRRYRILETSPDLRDRQRRRLGTLGVEWLDAIPEEPVDGVVFANEVADALPVERFRLTPERVESLHVGLDAGGFRWVPRPARSALRDHVRAVERRLGRPLGPAGYESEWCPSLPGWLDAITFPLRRGLLLVFDYGYGEAEYYHPDRGQGTLGCHYRHRWHDDPLVLPALQDITASVDFSALARAGDAAGMDRVGFTTQAWFLIGCGVTDFLAENGPDEDEPATGRSVAVRRAANAHAVRQLTLPGEMGERIRVLGLGRGLGERAADGFAGFSGRRLDDRL
ncbi:MAG: SAM-dependent methyltransferase [Immundisolibacterales bacterium]|nr:SAM-dependent methyltransferase [Immundisolibacterales bacterium]